MQIFNELKPDAFPHHEIVIYERAGRLVIVVNHDRCLARITLSPPRAHDSEPVDIIVAEPIPTPDKD